MGQAWLSVKEAAEELGLGRGSVYQLVADGVLACYRIGPGKGRIRLKAEDLAAYVEASRSGPSRKAPEPTPRPRYVPRHDVSKPPSSRRR